MNNDSLIRAVGRIEGKVDSMHESLNHLSDKVDHVDERLQTVERKAAVGASVISAAISAGISLLAAKMRVITGG